VLKMIWKKWVLESGNWPWRRPGSCIDLRVIGEREQNICLKHGQFCFGFIHCISVLMGQFNFLQSVDYVHLEDFFFL
jgi:hypothetical protein